MSHILAFHGFADNAAARALASAERAHRVAVDALAYALTERSMDALANCALRANEAAGIAADFSRECREQSDPSRAAWLSGLAQDAAELAQDFCDETLSIAGHLVRTAIEAEDRAAWCERHAL